MRRSAAVILALLVTSPAAAQQTWRLSPQPVLRIGTVDGDAKYELNMVKGALRLSDGRIVIANDHELRYFDVQGKHLLTTGRQGAGPGEFQYLGHIIPGRADTVLAWDNRMRLSRFDPAGRFIASENVDRRNIVLEGFFNEGSHLLADGSLLLPMYAAERPGENHAARGLYRPPVRLARYDVRTSTFTPLGDAVYGGLRQRFFDIGGRARPVVQPFTPHVQYAASSNRIYATDADRFLIDVYDYSGRRVAQFTGPRQPVPVQKKHLDDYHDRMVTMYRERNMAERLPDFERGWGLIDKPVTFPMFTSLNTDRAGLLWAGLYDPDATAPKQYVVLSANGVEVAQIALPPRFTPLDIGTDYVLGRYIDELDVQYVQLFTLMRR